MKRKWLLSLLLVGIVTAMVTGCGGNNNSDKGATNSNSPASATSSDNEKDKANDKPVTIKFVGWNPINQPLLDKFHEQIRISPFNMNNWIQPITSLRLRQEWQEKRVLM